jgi:hypothetical protein
VVGPPAHPTIKNCKTIPSSADKRISVDHHKEAYTIPFEVRFPSFQATLTFYEPVGVTNEACVEPKL